MPDPDLASDRAGMDMPGMAGMKMDDMLMPGMLTTAADGRTQGRQRGGFRQALPQRDDPASRRRTRDGRRAARNPGAVQDEIIIKFAGDVSADQSTEIDRMHVMLGSRP